MRLAVGAVAVGEAVSREQTLLLVLAVVVAWGVASGAMPPLAQTLISRSGAGEDASTDRRRRTH